jgi:hypothetical protein
MKKDLSNVLTTFSLIAVMLLGGTLVYGEKNTPVKTVATPISSVKKQTNTQPRISKIRTDDEENFEDSESRTAPVTAVQTPPTPAPAVVQPVVVAPVTTTASSRQSRAS